MNYKVLGFLTGGLVGALAVWGFNTWRHGSDENRLTAILRDHCVPYVQKGVPPFADTGRPVGVYDAAILTDSLINGGGRMLFDDRFVAQWGEGVNETEPVRVCTVNYNIARDGTSVLNVSPERIPELVITAVPDADLVAVDTDLTSFPALLSWQAERAEPALGLTVMFAVLEDGVSNMTIAQSIDN